MQGCCGLPCTAGSVPPRGGTALLHVADAVSRWTPAKHEAPGSLVVTATGDCADCFARTVNAVLSHLPQRNGHLLHSTPFRLRAAGHAEQVPQGHQASGAGCYVVVAEPHLGKRI